MSKRRDVEPAATPPSHELRPPLSTDPPAELKAQGGQGVSFEEQVEIIGQIDETLRRNRLQLEPDTFHFTPRKKGGFIPILINAGAAAITLAAAVLIVVLFNARERTLVRPATAVLTAEGRLIQALKKETEEQLRGKDQEISQIQASLTRLVQERDKLRLDSQARLARQEAELRTALDKELAVERQKLERTGLASASVERQLADLEGRLTGANQKQLAELRRQAESELAAKDASLAAQAERYADNLQAFQQERVSLQAELTSRLREQAAAAAADRSRLAEQSAALAGLRESRQQEQLVLDQLLSAYLKVMEAWKNSLYDEALRNLEGVRELLSRESVVSLPAIQSRLPVERFVIDSLSRLIETDRSGNKAAELERRQLADELGKAQKELSRLQAGEQRRDEQKEQLKAWQDRITAEGRAAASAAQAQMLSLLETKLRVRQVLAAEPVRSQNPGLYEQLEKFLEAYGQEQRQEGQVEALQDATAVLEGLSQRSPRLDTGRLKGDYNGAARGPLARFTDKLRGLLE